MNQSRSGCGSVAPEIASALARLEGWFGDCPGAVVAFSGGVDSAVAARAAREYLALPPVAVIADSPSLARSELELAEQTAGQIGIAFQIVRTAEVADPAYQVNDAQRCFHCKTHLYANLQTLPQVQQGWWVLSGANADDVGDWRPGMAAAANFQVRSPLLELGLGKVQVRQLAHHWRLAVADKPASPCLASRLAYGLPVNAQRLQMVEQAEAVLRELGFRQFRVRLHADNLARIEVPVAQLAQLIDAATRQILTQRFSALGFRYLTVDLEGFASGSLNKMILQ